MMSQKFNSRLLVSEINDNTRRTDTITSLSIDMGVKYSALYRVFKGFTPSIETALAICDWLEKDISHFIFDEPVIKINKKVKSK